MRREVNIPGFGTVKVMEMLCPLLHRVLCFRSVCFCFPCSPLLFFFLLSRSPHCLILLFFLSFSPSVSCLFRSPSVYLSFRSFQKDFPPSVLSPYAAQFSFLLVLFSMFSPCSLLLPPWFSLLLLLL